MKKLSYITLMVALLMGLQFSTYASSISETVDGPTLSTAPTGDATAEYVAAEEAIVVDMVTAGDRERVLVTVTNPRGQVVAREYVVANGKGAQTHIEMRGAPEGSYLIEVSSNTIEYTAKMQIR